MRDAEVDEKLTIINYKEKITKAYGAHVVKKKGAESGVAKRIIKQVVKWGIKEKIIVKTDQEPSIQAVAEEMHYVESLPISFFAADPQDGHPNVDRG